MKKILFSCMLMMLFVCANGAFAAEGVSGEIGEIQNSGGTSLVTLHIQNETDQVYSYGWVNTCFLHIQTDEQDYRIGIGSPDAKILPGKNEYQVQMPVITGKVISASVIGICPLDSQGLPVIKEMKNVAFDLTLSLDKIKDINFKVAQTQTAPESDQSIAGAQGFANAVAERERINEQISKDAERNAAKTTSHDGWILTSLWVCLLIGLVVSAEVFLYIDTGKRNMSKWWMLSPLGNGIGFFLYLIYRNKCRENDATNKSKNNQASHGVEENAFDDREQQENINREMRQGNEQIIRQQNEQTIMQQMEAEQMRLQAEEAHKSVTPFEQGGNVMTQGNSFHDLNNPPNNF